MKNLIIYYASLSFAASATCGQTFIDTYDAAFDWLVSVAATGTISSADAAAYAVVASHYLPVAGPSEFGGLAIEKTYKSLKNVFAAAFSDGNWTDDNISIAYLAGYCLVGIASGSEFESNILLQTKAFGKLYAGTNEIVLAAIEWQDGGCSNLPPAFSEKWFQDVLDGSLSELANRETGILEAFFTMEFLWHKIRMEGSLSPRRQAGRLIYSETDYAKTLGFFKFLDSKKGTFHDTCMALILRNGSIGNGYLRPQKWPRRTENKQNGIFDKESSSKCNKNILN